MFDLFGIVASRELSEALDKTFKKFEAMPAAKLFSLGREHVGGDVASFVSACSGIENPHVTELKFVFDSPDTNKKGFTAFFSQKSTLSFSLEDGSGQTHPYSSVSEGCAYLGVASIAIVGSALCQAA
ncbi:hypothetical protein [Pseudomonas syringae]|uniref:hypothetical protein n=1 Tax=Pseudomonas syringae TaxID=317 RepID=UPI001372B820|nr:hypothetical protein [Pseudomonas syringae]